MTIFKNVNKVNYMYFNKTFPMLKNKPISFISGYLVSIEFWDKNFFDTFSPFSSK